jgi:O-antigen/teichoic acid export membrane protein
VLADALVFSRCFPSAFTASGRQRAFFLVTGIALILRLVPELWLIRKFGYMAACIVAAWCEILSFAAFVLLLAAVASGMWYWRLLSKPVFAELVMRIALLCGARYFGAGNGLVLAAGICYAEILIGARTLSKAELLRAREALSFLWTILAQCARKAGYIVITNRGTLNWQKRGPVCQLTR